VTAFIPGGKLARQILEKLGVPNGRSIAGRFLILPRRTQWALAAEIAGVVLIASRDLRLPPASDSR
jgi:hypothetical protein